MKILFGVPQNASDKLIVHLPPTSVKELLLSDCVIIDLFENGIYLIQHLVRNHLIDDRCLHNCTIRFAI
jgi:hypothetical protein